ncbi:MAG: prepilin-type N-terminal cleavage/methylation domain-containing protein [bacterium]
MTRRKTKNGPHCDRRSGGFTLLEALVAIGLTVIMLSVYTALLTGVFYLSRTKHELQAAGFVQEELDTLRTVSHDDLLNRESGNLLGLSFTRGLWSVEESAGNRLLRLAAATSDLNGETGLVVLPGNYRQDFIFSARVMARGESPVGWGAGLVFRYRDAENHYRLRFNSAGLALDEVYRGEITTLWSQGGAYNKDTWYTLEVDAVGDQLTVKKNGLIMATKTGSRFVSGDLGLLSLSGGRTDFDDVAASDAYANDSWSFEADQVGALPDEWRRLSPFDLPNGNATLTISDYLNEPKMKQAIVTVSWNDAGTNRSVSGSSVIVR